MVRKISVINEACQEILAEYANSHAPWIYQKSEKWFKREVSKDAYLLIDPCLSSKVDFVNFQFSMRVCHRLGRRVSEIRGLNKPHYDFILFRHGDRWAPPELSHGDCTVYDPKHADFSIFEEARDESYRHYVHLDEFPTWLDTVFKLAEAEIARLFDLSSEEALIRSILAHPMGFFWKENMLIINLLMDNPGYFAELEAQSLISPPNPPQKGEGWNYEREMLDKIMALYNQGLFPKFPFA